MAESEVRAEPWSLLGAARVIGGYVWLEERLFEIVGGWVPSVPEPAVKLRFEADSHHHAWHASLWRERLPALREVEPDAFVAPATPPLEQALSSVAQSATTVERLVSVYRVLAPRLAVGYQRHQERASAVADGPTIRALDLVLADERRDWQEGEALVQSVLTSSVDVAHAAAWQRRLESLLVGAAAFL
ncbi:MAG: hypothetical protein ACRDZ8_14620 [Acidimicrobiales bacterium]